MSPPTKRRPAVNGAAEEKTPGDGLSSAMVAESADARERLRRTLRALVRQIDLDEQLRRRAVQQAILTATAWWWVWRAEDFHRARPRPSDFNGRATPAELAAADERCREVAQACLNKAALIEWEAAEDD